MRDDRSTGVPAPSVWHLSLAIVAAVLLVLGVGLLIARAAGFSEVRDAVQRADAAWLAVCLGGQILALSAYADVFREAFKWRGGCDPGYRLSNHVMLASIGATRVFAAAGAGALAASYWCFRRVGFSTREALVRVLGFNMLFYVSFAAGTWVAALLVVLGLSAEASFAFTGPWLVGVPLSFLVAWFVTKPGRADELATAEGFILRRALAFAIAGAAWVRAVLGDPAGRRPVLSSILYWVGNVLCLWAALRSVGHTLPLPELALAFATGHAATILPLPLGGVGGVDAAMTYALTVVGVPLAAALVGVAVYRLFAFWAPTVPALAALLTLPRAGRRLEQVAVASAACSSS